MSPKQRQNLLHSSDWLSFLYYICHGNNKLDFTGFQWDFKQKVQKKRMKKVDSPCLLLCCCMAACNAAASSDSKPPLTLGHCPDLDV
jgi:hypothetical protein